MNTQMAPAISPQTIPSLGPNKAPKMQSSRLYPSFHLSASENPQITPTITPVRHPKMRTLIYILIILTTMIPSLIIAEVPQTAPPDNSQEDCRNGSYNKTPDDSRGDSFGKSPPFIACFCSEGSYEKPQDDFPRLLLR